MRRAWIIIMVYAALQSAPLRADDASAHFAAHFGMSYAINVFTFGVAKQAFRMNSTDAFLFSAVTTLMIGAVYKFTEIAPNDTESAHTIPRAMLENAAGCAAFGATIVMFKF